ncbi:hypothetical protein CHLRE_03g148850v5 [Chlamydomonas reinhardtii]|uniref:Protein kinase domain-containing protein n=1 Tax=Chlamydomonas reinhardtii TaxID=3055 RepID=A0A2K3DVK3_CHLRE|nr:uncharacterized protein CHLRE_03g148850v5 [Chlamydomonas reinhardtii]PNW84558.1 hypothetical protein CHLRE_03g148850v5 [Chlamydomonas reinhardtii]
MSGMVRRGGGGGDSAAGSKSNGACTSSSASSNTGSGGSGVAKVPPRQLWCPAALRAAAAARAGSSGGGGSSSCMLDAENGTKDGSRSVVARGAAKGSGATLGYPAPRRTVTLFEEAPLYLDNCPQWLKSHSLWSPRLPTRLVDVTRLGEGRHGSVALVTQRGSSGAGSGQQRAVLKQFVRDRLLESPRVHQKVLAEWRVHSRLTHEFIVPLYGAVEDRGYVTFLMEAQQGDLLWYLDEQDSEVMGEDEGRAVMADVLAALCYMHEKGYVHRDIKPENIFLSPGAGGGPGAARCGARRGTSRATSGSVHTTWRLGDLGSAVELAEVMQPGAPGLFLEGSPPFLAPEYVELWMAPSGHRTPARLQQATSFKQDIWALGATLYDILVGHPPFSGPAGADPPMSELAAAIMSAPPCPHPAEVPGLSPAAADFICWTLQKDPALRPTAFELVEHPWLMGASEMPTAAAMSVQAHAANVVLADAAGAPAEAEAEAGSSRLLPMDASMAEEAAREVAAAVIADLSQSVDAAGLAAASAKAVTAAHAAAAAAAADAGPSDGGALNAEASTPPHSPNGRLPRSKSLRKTPASTKKSLSALATAAAALLAVADPTASGDSPSSSLDAGSLQAQPTLLVSAAAAPVPRRKASARRVPSRKTGAAPEAVEGTVVGGRLAGIAEAAATAPVAKPRASRKASAGAAAQAVDGTTSESSSRTAEAASTSAAAASVERSLTPKRRGRKPASGSPAATGGPATSLLLVPGLLDLSLLDPAAVVAPSLQPGAVLPKVARNPRVRKAAASPLAAAFDRQDSAAGSPGAASLQLMVSDEAAAASALATAAAVMVAGVATAASGTPRSRGRKQAEAAAAAAAAASTPARAARPHAFADASDSPSTSGSLDEKAVAGLPTAQGSPAKRRGRKAAAAAAAAPGSPGGPVRLAPAAPAERKTGEAVPAVGGATVEKSGPGGVAGPAVALPPTASLLARPSGEKIDWLHMF